MKRTYTCIANGVVLASIGFCMLGTAIAVLLTVDLPHQVVVANGVRLGVFAIFMLSLPAALVIGIRAHFFTRTEADREVLHWISLSSLTAAGCLLIANGAFNIIDRTGHQRIVFGDRFVRVTGNISKTLAIQLDAQVDPSLKIDRIELANPGGDAQGALAAARWLRGRGVERAVVIGDCASACAFLALLLPLRDIVPGARMGFHDLRSDTGDSVAAQATRADLVNLLLANGIPHPLISQLLSVSPTDIRWYTPHELHTLHLITGCWDPVAFRDRPCGD